MSAWVLPLGNGAWGAGTNADGVCIGGCEGGGGANDGRACGAIVEVLGEDAKEYKNDSDACFLDRTGYIPLREPNEMSNRSRSPARAVGLEGW